jgi:hypothetical protein
MRIGAENSTCALFGKRFFSPGRQETGFFSGFPAHERPLVRDSRGQLDLRPTLERALLMLRFSLRSRR